MFLDQDHKRRFVTIMQKIGKIYDDNKFDAEYSAALYLLTAHLGTWNAVKKYVSRDGIEFYDMLAQVDFSGGYSVLIRLAANLFYSQFTFASREDEHVIEPIVVAPVEVPARLDDSNFELALDAMRIRRYGLSYPLRAD